MRIRKNAKISTLLYTTTNVGDECLIQKNTCQLNQSPWDIINFPSQDSSSSLHQFDDYEVYYNVNRAGNGSSIDSIGDFESLGDNVASMKTIEGENYNLVDPNNDDRGILGFEEEILLCDVRDVKGWQCGRVVRNGETVCDHHMIEVQNHAVWTTKKKPGSGSGSGSVRGSMAGARSRQTKKRASTSPYEFYYYSGFGPSWGKKRGTSSTVSNVYNEPADVASNDKKVKETGSYNDTGVREEEGKRFEPETSETRPAKMELTYVDDGVDGIKTRKTGKKRGRKPMKARSLKSLM